MTTEPARLLHTRRIGSFALLACASVALIACQPAADKAAAPAAPSAAEQAASAALAEVQAKQAAEAERAASEVERLRKENAELKAKQAKPTPAPPPPPAAAQAPDRPPALALKSLPVSPRFSADGASISLLEADIGRQWRSDNYDSSFQIEEAARGQRLVTARATITSKKKDPDLMGVGVYRADGTTLVKVGDLGYRFARWDDRESYLGNKPDLSNDFARRPDVRFSMGTQVDASQLKGPIYLVATREGCHRSSFKRERTPQVRYNTLTCASLKPLLTVSDFQDGRLGVLKVLGAGKR